MLKRWMLLLITGLLVTQIAGCGKNKEEEPTEVIVESAVDNTTADSDAVQSEIEELPPLVEEPKEEKEEEEEKAEEPVFGKAELVCSIPKNFEVYAGDEGLYVHKSYPNDLSSISYVISESDEDVSAIEKEEYKQMLEDDFYEAYGDEVEVIITQYKNIKVDGRPGLKIKLNYEFKGIAYEELVYMIYNKDESHIVCYTQEKGGKWAEEFENSGDSISLKSKQEKIGNPDIKCYNLCIRIFYMRKKLLTYKITSRETENCYAKKEGTSDR